MEWKNVWFSLLNSDVTQSVNQSTKILFFVKNELPIEFPGLFADEDVTLEEANELYGFDISKYIYSSLEPTIGDINADGLINPIDSTLALNQYASYSLNEKSSLSERALTAADVNEDGIINPVDATLILRYYSYVAMNGTDTFKEFINNN